jgi:hypothetical protein
MCNILVSLEPVETFRFPNQNTASSQTAANELSIRGAQLCVTPVPGIRDGLIAPRMRSIRGVPVLSSVKFRKPYKTMVVGIQIVIMLCNMSMPSIYEFRLSNRHCFTLLPHDPTLPLTANGGKRSFKAEFHHDRVRVKKWHTRAGLGRR